VGGSTGGGGGVIFIFLLLKGHVAVPGWVFGGVSLLFSHFKLGSYQEFIYFPPSLPRYNSDLK